MNIVYHREREEREREREIVMGNYKNRYADGTEYLLSKSRLLIALR